MPQSYQSIPIHLIWSTKNRIPLIFPEIEEELFKYMASIFHNHDSPALLINGSIDHVHILSSLSRTITIAKLTEEVKRSSSKWIKSKGTRFEKFYWQTGYAVFGVGRHNIENVKMYIRNQKIHHRMRTFKEEYIEFLKKHTIAYDERYIWE